MRVTDIDHSSEFALLATHRDSTTAFELLGAAVPLRLQ